MKSGGNLGADALADANNAWWSVSAWQERPLMQAYVDTEPHRGISARLDHYCDEATFVLGLSCGSSVGPSSVTWDTLPFGAMAVRRGEHVHATDGDIGQVQGLVIDSGSHQVTHVLLQEGHVFGRKVVAIPIGVVTDVGEDGIQLNITKQQVKDLLSGWHRSSG